ncbi:hypothetical protein BCR42DRAFT_419285 [Absidia repens]|uniref:Uncharacterized protein n=1 Tax=Absidia repens TaxID=90262 RepID=A0A1X2IB22_9FUNG|nr:hypothetical protein BCR42DRAFT_419285 [Absidia repens]
MITSRGQRGATAPSTIFTTTSQLSPRQIANKAMTLGCKKLDTDDKRTRPQYNVRERLLICNTIAYAEQVLNQRTRRTNRRVMAAEDDDSHFDAQALTPSMTQTDQNSSQLPHHHHHHHHHEDASPLRASLDGSHNENDDGNDNDQIVIGDQCSDRIPANDYQKWDKDRMTSSPIVAL